MKVIIPSRGDPIIAVVHLVKEDLIKRFITCGGAIQVAAACISGEAGKG
jgi:hypothetical protein